MWESSASRVLVSANSSQVDELWDSMCQGTLSLISSSVAGTDNVEILLRVMSSVSLFVQTMEVSIQFPWLS